MGEHDSFARYWPLLCQGDDEATRVVFERFRDQLLQLASAQFDTWIRDRADPEGVLQSVFRSFFCRTRQGQFDLDGWASLWTLLTVLTLRKCRNRLTYLNAQCRSPAREESPPNDGADLVAALNRLPTPEEAAALAETVELLLLSFEVPERPLVEMILQGCDVVEIHEQTDRAERTVRRLRAAVRSRLERLLGIAP